MALTQDDLWALKDLEQRLVETGVASNATGAAAALVAAGLAAPVAVSFVTLTEAGWTTAAALRRHLAAHSEQMRATNGQIPDFTPPAAPDILKETSDVARAVFVAAMAADPAADPVAVAVKADSSAAAFVCRAKAVLPANLQEGVTQ